MRIEIAPTLEKIKSQIQALVARIEESQAFERLMIRYENADPRHQKRMVMGAYAGVLALAALILLVPLFSLWSQKGDLREIRALTADVKAQNAKGKVVYRPAPPPQGWQGLAAGNVDDLEQSLAQFMSSMGIPQDLTTVTKSGNGLDIKTTGASLRQLTAMLFLFDGWYPGIKVRSMSVNVSEASREMIDFSFSIELDPVEAARVSAGRGGGDPSAAINSFMNAPSQPQARAGGGDAGAPPPGNDFDYQTNLPPPPPPAGGGDFEEYNEPLEPPPDLPPPPPLEEDL